MKNKIKFSHFLKEDGTTCKSITSYAGDLSVPESLEDVEIKLDIQEDGSIKMEIIDQYIDKDGTDYLNKIFKKMDWDNGYEFLTFFNNSDTKIGNRYPTYELIGDRDSKMSDIIYSDKNIKNLQKMNSALKKHLK